MSSARPSILLVEDDRSLGELVSTALIGEGYSVSVESDGEWALRAASQQRFDAVVLDLLLPTLDGYAVARKLRSQLGAHAPPVIFVSGVYQPSETSEEMRERYGAVTFLSKPFELKDLLAALKAAVGEPDKETLTDPSAAAEADHVERTSKHLSALRALRGDFDTKPFPEVLSEVHRWHATGALLVHRDRAKKIIYLRDGAVLSVKSNQLSECLGQVLVRERLISEQECAESVHRMHATQRRQGAVLVGMGCLSPQNLSYGLSLQLRSKLYDVFGWESGDYQFVPMVEGPADPVQLGLSIASLILDGVRRGFTRERLSRVLAGMDGRYPARSPHPMDALQNLVLSEDEDTLLRSMSGRRTVEELREDAPLPDLDFDRFLYSMICAHVVDLSTTPIARRPGERTVSSVSVVVELDDLASGPPSLPEVRASDPKIRSELMAKVDAARMQDPFEVLGLSRDAPQTNIDEAFLNLASEYHPDRFAHVSSMELKALAAELYERAARAYEALSDPAERAHVLAALDSGRPLPSPASVDRLLRAEGRFREGQTQLAANDLTGAHAAFQEAVEIYPLDGNFYAHLGWTRYRLHPDRADEALSLLERAVELNPTLDRAYLYLGHVHRALGQRDRAEEQYEKALACNPACLEALEQLKSLGTRTL